MFARFQRILFVPLMKYNEVLERKPLLTKSITTGVMYGAGDAIAQYVENLNADEKDKKELFDLKRLAVFTLFGTVIGGPAFHYWYNYLNEVPAMLLQLKRSRQKGKILRAYAYLKSFGIVVHLDKTKLPMAAPLGKWQKKAVKLFADQFIFASAYLLVFFMGVGTLTKAAERSEILYLTKEPNISLETTAKTPQQAGQEAGEIIDLMKLKNPAVADILDQLEEQLDQLFEGDDRLQDYDSDTKYQYSLISKIFHKIRQVSECAAATSTTAVISVLYVLYVVVVIGMMMLC